jgi:hypothetical protein
LCRYAENRLENILRPPIPATTSTPAHSADGEAMLAPDFHQAVPHVIPHQPKHKLRHYANLDASQYPVCRAVSVRRRHGSGCGARAGGIVGNRVGIRT